MMNMFNVIFIFSFLPFLGVVCFGLLSFAFPGPSTHKSLDSNLGLARFCMEDVFLTMLDTDGVEWTRKLLRRLNQGKDRGEPKSDMDDEPIMESSPLLSSAVTSSKKSNNIAHSSPKATVTANGMVPIISPSSSTTHHGSSTNRSKVTKTAPSTSPPRGKSTNNPSRGSGGADKTNVATKTTTTTTSAEKKKVSPTRNKKATGIGRWKRKNET